MSNKPLIYAQYKIKEEEKTQKIRKKTIKTTTILLILAFTLTFIALPTNTAQSAWKTYAYIGAMPNPVGVGQETLLHIGISQQLAWSTDGWEGLTVTVTKPDNTTQTLGPFRTDSTGGTGYVFVPNSVGTYYLQTNFPEQTNPSTIRAFGGKLVPEGATMLASTSEKLELVVNEETIEYYPGQPLPAEYWSRPIDSQLREWAQISGNWLASPPNFYVPYNDAPESAHILWTTPLTSGGLAGGALDNSEEITDHSYEIGDAYEGKWQGSLVLGGKLYYQKYATGDPFKETVCVDLHTGKELWSRVLLDNRTLTRGQLLYWDTYDYHGVYDYLWASASSTTRNLLGLSSSAGTTWCAFDPFNGDFVYALYGIPSGTLVYGPKGEMLLYYVNLNRGYMTLWNSTNIPELYASTQFGSMGWGQWRAMGKIVNATGAIESPTTPLGLAGYMWNKTIPTNLPGSVRGIFTDKIVGSDINETHVVVWALSLAAGQEGQLLFKTTWQAPSEWADGNLYISSAAVSENVYTVWSKEERKYYGFSATTGNYMWKTAEPEYYLQMYVSTTRAIAYDKLYSTGASGIVYCYDANTGEKLWEYHASDTYSEILWANDWWNRLLFISDGKIYCGHEEHSPIDPRPRGAPFLCLNATTGEVIWRADGLFRSTHWGGRAVIGDGIIATQDTYDQRVYAVGKGPSRTTVIGPEIGVPLGTSINLRGTVTDISPGTLDYTIMARFPNGVPAVSDSSMSEWMLYVYKQFPRPTSVTGVEVTISVVDANGNYREIGTTSASSDGYFSLPWTPDISGEYKVYASFAGSEAYYPSHAETSFNVDPAAPTPAPTDAPLTSVSDAYFVPAVAGIIVAIAVGFAITILVLRKRP